MYHDEFARMPARSPRTDGQDLPPGVAMEVGGGLSLGLAASLNQPLATVLFYLGGLLPLVTCSLSIAAHRASELLALLSASPEAPRPSALPHPHWRASSPRLAGHHMRTYQRARSIR
jgi:hypothetical protein